MNKFIIFLSIIALSVCAEKDTQFPDYEVYKIENKNIPDGVLSVHVGPQNLTDIPRITIFNDDPGQKWRLESSKLYTAFQLRPTSYESFVLEQVETGTFLQWAASITHFGNHKLWYLNDAGNNFTQIKNKHYDTCLAASVNNAEIFAAPCSNGNEQQWKVTKLSSPPK